MSDTESVPKATKSRKNKAEKTSKVADEEVKLVADDIKPVTNGISDKPKTSSNAESESEGGESDTESKKNKKPKKAKKVASDDEQENKKEKKGKKSKKTNDEAETEADAKVNGDDTDKGKKDKKSKPASESESESDHEEKSKKTKKGRDMIDQAMDKEELCDKNAMATYTEYIRHSISAHLETWQTKKTEYEPENLGTESFLTYKQLKKGTKNKKLKPPFSPNPECKEALKWFIANMTDEYAMCQDDIDVNESDSDKIAEAVAKFIPTHKNTFMLVPFVISVLRSHGRFPMTAETTQYGMHELDRAEFVSSFKKMLRKCLDKGRLMRPSLIHLIVRFLDLVTIPLARARWFGKVALFALPALYDSITQLSDVNGVVQADAIAFRQAMEAYITTIRKKKESDKKKSGKGKGKGKGKSKGKGKGKKSKKDDDSADDNSDGDEDADADDDDGDKKKKKKKTSTKDKDKSKGKGKGKGKCKKKAAKSDDDEDTGSESDAESDPGSN